MRSGVQVTEKQASYQDTEASTAETVREMCGHIAAALSDPEVRRVALEAVTDGGPCRSRRELAAAVWAWLKRNIRFVPDEVQLFAATGRRDELELLISPSVMLRPELLEAVRGVREMQGDCDCFTMTAAALFSVLNVPALIKTFKCQRAEPWRWSHVCCVVQLEDGSILPCDASHGDYPGWEVPAIDQFETALWDLHGNKVGGSTMRGMRGYRDDAGWTGDPMTAAAGVGPYAAIDSMRYWYPLRAAGLGAIAARRFGMGDGDSLGGSLADAAFGTSGGAVDVSSDPFSSAGSFPLSNNAGNAGAFQSASSPSTNSVWANLFGQLANAGVRLAGQAIGTGAQVLPNGNVLLPSGQVISGAPQSAGISSQTLLIGGGILLAVLVVSAMKK